ncbi:MAG: hypothetical protein C4520_17865 [Candidatus Abyssobacteria bacterium SURF_5]|uniref:DNA-binding protein n=1 Tax=Abyssobacteria bacterium (strain SURF_5) TaxID=2093360 RepID=A0A3A4NBN6_ABYX5|nr:MAG: hypothetical protein C4520_17865 [Candidatus Abyssubacteria bacterium SURF_5]
MSLEFLVILLFVFILGALVMALGTRAAPIPFEEFAIEDDPMPPEPSLEELVDIITEDEDLLRPAPPVRVPHRELPGARLGGGAVDEMQSKACVTVALALQEDASERRKYNRRLGDRRFEDHPVEGERRLIQRRIWLRRKEDRRGKVLLNITDAAHTLGVTIEQVYKWLDSTDIPFCQVTDGKRKAIRFEVNELMQWHSKFAARSRKNGPYV